jgi:hypothetical protein
MLVFVFEGQNTGRWQAWAMYERAPVIRSYSSFVIYPQDKTGIADVKDGSCATFFDS